MHLERLWLTDFRSYADTELVPAPEGLTVVIGANGEGKTNLLEAVAYLSTLRSFRGAPGEAMIRVGADRAVVRAETRRDGRSVLIEAELRPAGRDRVRVNRQPLRRTRDLLQSFQVTVFSPEDVGLVKGSPAARRDYLDDLLVALHPRHDACRTEVEHVLRQRNALLKSVAGTRNPGPEVLATLDVWDFKLATAGETLVMARDGLAQALQPVAEEYYAGLAGGPSRNDQRADRSRVALVYRRSWTTSLAEALSAARVDDLRRGVSTVGPQRDDLELQVGPMPARTHASQGEQRSLALALRLAGHRVVTERLGTPPVLLLDDVFSELDRQRASALVLSLPPGQAMLTTAGDLPPGASPEMTWHVEDGLLSSGVRSR